MEWLMIAAVAGLVLVETAALSMRAAARSRTMEAEYPQLSELTEVRSPSGKRFFASDESIWDLASELDELAGREPAEPRKAARR